MPTTFEKADEHHPVHNFVHDAIRRWHLPLAAADVKVGVIFARNPDRHAVTHGGYPCAATIKVVPLKDRLSKDYDAELLIEHRTWEVLDEEQCLALIDHELSHLNIVIKDGQLQRDDLGRPKLKLRKADWNGGDGFRAVVERHGDNALEFLNAKRIHGLVLAAKGEGQK